MAVTVEMRTQVSQLYVALFGRAPDAEGLGFWTQMLADGASVVEVADTMYATDPARSYYPLFLTNEEIIASFYENVLGRPADAEGLAFWTAKLNAPGATPGAVIQEMIDVVVNYTGTDPDGLVSAALFANKVEVAQAYGEAGGDIDGATAILVGITDDHATVDAALASLSAPEIGDTLFLTDGVDDITIATANTADTIKGIVNGDSDGETSGSTFTALDSIQGNGHTVVELATTESGNAAPATTLNDIKTIELISAGASWVNFNAGDWHDIGDIQLNSGNNGLWASFSNLHTGVDLSVGAALSGGLSATYTDAHAAWIWAGKNASISYMDGGDISGTAGAGMDVSASVWATTDSVDLTVGDVTLAGTTADSVYVGVQNSQDVGGDIAIGNVAIDGFENIRLDVENTDHTAMSPAVNTTVGDVTLAVGDSGTISASVSNWSYGVAGNTTVGDVSLTAGDNVTSAWFYLYQWGGPAAGDVTVGDISMTGGVSATDIDVWIENYAGWMGGAATAPITQGMMTVGDINYNLGMNATGYASVSAAAYTTAAGIGASVGDYTVGDINAMLAQAADLDMWFYNEADVNGGGAASVADTVMGNLNLDLAVDASFSLTLDVSANSNGPAASVGNVTIGDADINMGINSYASVEYSVYAYGTDPAQVSVGDVSIGNVNAVIDDGGHLDHSISITSYGDLGNVAIGDLTLALGVSASAHIYWSDIWASNDMGNLSVGDMNLTAGQSASIDVSVSATASHDMGNVNFGNLSAMAALSADITVYNEVSASNDMGNVSIGNLDLSAANNAYVYVSHDFSAWNGAIGNVTIGDVSASAATSADAYYDFYMSGETAIGDVSIGDVSVSAVGTNASASAYFDIENDGVGTIGDIMVGDVDVTVNGDSAWGGFYISASSATSGGTVTVGDLDLSVGTLAQKTAYLDVSIGNDLGDVVVGDINVTGTSVRATGDVTMAYTADVSIWSAGNISIGTVSVSGGDDAADNFQALGFLSTTAGGVVSLGGVDYSGYGAAATLDVSGYAGDTVIVGSAFGDLITDNTGANAITGGAGADTFTFLDGNTGLTIGTMDQLLDFNNAGGDKIDLSVAVNVGNYGEAAYADFASFAAGANAADKAVWVGLVGSDGYAAVDYDTDGAVDYMIELVGLNSLGNIDVASFV